MGKYLDKIRQHEHGEPVPPNETGQAAPVPPIQPGAQITWTRGDGSTQGGVVDYLYVDETGTRWAFISIGESWAAINLKFVTLVEEGGQH